MKSKKKIIFSLVTLVILIVFILAINFEWVKAYYQNITRNHFHYGDKIYVNEKFLGSKIDLHIPIFRILKGHDSVSNSNSGAIVSNITNSKLRAIKTNYIGTYNDSKLLRFSYKGKKYVVCLYSITPNWKAAESLNDMDNREYSSIDTGYYILASFPYIKQ